MFKCKIKLEEYDKENKKAANIDFVKAKNLSKAAVKKLAGKEGGKAPFYILKDYFEKGGKPVGHFLAFGVAKKLEMQFSKKEVKGTGIAKSKKDAAFGEAYIKTLDAKKMLHFAPNPACKVPKGLWPKLLKSLKPMLAGIKAVVVLGGETIRENDDKQEAEATKKENSNSAKKTKIETKNRTKSVKEMLLGKKLAANKAIKEINFIKNIYDRDKKEELYNKSKEWLEKYNSLDDKHKKHVELEAKTMQKINVNTSLKLKKDNKVTQGMNKIYKLLDRYLDMDDFEDDKGKSLSKTIINLIDSLKADIKIVNDFELLQECNEIIDMLQ